VRCVNQASSQYSISFISKAPLMMARLSLGCLFINCRNQISAVFLHQSKPQSEFYPSILYCTTHVGASFSWMFVSKSQRPKPARSNMTYNGWLGRGHEVGVVWVLLAAAIFYFWEYYYLFRWYSINSSIHKRSPSS